MKYDELISKLCERAPWCPDTEAKLMAEAANAIADLIFALKASNDVIVNNKPKWIPVSERFPEENTKVLIVTERRNVIYGTFADGLFSDDWQYYTPDYVVWWMYIPKPPKEET